MPTRVVNRHRAKFDVYVGRGTLWGNTQGKPGDDRLTSIERYRIWFLDKIAHDPEFRAETEKLRGKVLGCSCAPQPCHAMVIAAWLDGEL